MSFLINLSWWIKLWRRLKKRYLIGASWPDLGATNSTREENYENTFSSRASAQSRLARRDCWICEVRRWRHVNGPRWWARCKQSRLTDTLLGHVLSFDTLSRALSASSTARCHAALCALSLHLYSTPTLYYTLVRKSLTLEYVIFCSFTIIVNKHNKQYQNLAYTFSSLGRATSFVKIGRASEARIGSK